MMLEDDCRDGEKHVRRNDEWLSMMKMVWCE